MERFCVAGDFVEACPYGSGHINDTYAVTMDQAGRTVRYILQRINHRVFPDPPRLMENIHRICRELGAGLRRDGEERSSRRALTVVCTREGAPVHQDDQGGFWRVYYFIEGALGYDVVENHRQAFEAARAFGEFQRLLADLPGPRLHETIPGFHDTPRRLERFRQVFAEAPRPRREAVRVEAEFFLSRHDEASRLVSLQRQGLLPERVTHNDTKLNNVLIDQETHQAVCVIDLDTVMPGLVPYDFGDLVRTSTTRAVEDERDLEKVRFDREFFLALARGYLSSAGAFLTPLEREHLVFGGFLMTYEVGVRFLTDYLEGNVYFKTAYDEHNLVRARTQIALASQIEAVRGELEEELAQIDRA
ncbi:mucin desulfatase [Alkalispirochaeta sphaeroplastigenens]|uniref:Mucin desulfatase n=2 Tax=Spirochaetaceae TaxID=137 RepID=A0A2S4JJG8_9SPIO|nr:mucin desulfatase [Alkalispirochaeta sphaeroplastigenens]